MYALPITPTVQSLLEQRRVFDNPHGRERRWRVGERLLTDGEFAIEPYSQIEQGHSLPRAFGAFSYAKSALPLYARVGRYCSIGSSVFWLGGDHPTAWATSSPVGYDPEPKAALRRYFDDIEQVHQGRPWSDGKPPEVEIGHDVWIGDAVTIAPHVRIGHGAVIGACALVLKDVPPYAVVVGSPARVLRYRFEAALIAQLLALEWWRYAPEVLQAAAIDQPARFVEELPQMVQARGAQPYAPEPLVFADLMAALRAEA
jgi:acetyltransferase-like isoleucine patch superfamily enzyme